MVKNIGIVGTGVIATEFVTQLDTKKYTIHSVYNRNSKSLETFRKTHKLHNGYTDYNEFLEDEELDCVYIATPNQTHYDYAKKAIEKGKHVLCEKVMVLNSAQANELFELAKKHHVVILEAVTLFYMPMYHEVSRLLKQDVLGKISSANITFGSCKEYDVNNRFFSLEKGGGALFDIGPYALSAAVYLLGTDIELVSSEVVMAPSGVDEKSVTTLKTKNNELASVMLSFRGKLPKQILVTGDEGYLQINDFPRATTAEIFFNDGSTQVIEAGDDRDVFTYEMDMLNHLANEKDLDHVPDCRKVSQRVIQLMDAMRQEWGWELS